GPDPGGSHRGPVRPDFGPMPNGPALSPPAPSWQPGCMPRRLVQLFAGLVLYGISDSMLLLAGLGVDPWDVLHQGLARRTGVPVGTWAIIAGAVVLLWIPLRQRPGLGTLCNVVLVGAVIDLVLAVVPPPHSLLVQVAVMASGVVLNGV